MEKVSDLEIDRGVFLSVLKNKRCREILADLDIADEDQLGLFESLDIDGSETLSLPEIIQGIKKLRGDPRRSDVIHVSLLVRDIQDMLRNIGRLLQVQEERLRSKTTTYS